MIGSAPPASKVKRGSLLLVVLFLATAGAVGLLMMVGTKPALAAFPGENGKIAFSSNRDGGNYEVYVMDPDGQNQTRLTNNNADFEPDWGVAVQDKPQCTITGTEANNVLVGTSGNDVICGLGGSDTIYGGGGNDTIYGDAGNDVIQAGAGTDIVKGGEGNDTINTFDFVSANDTIDGEGGTDTCSRDQGDSKTNCEYGN